MEPRRPTDWLADTTPPTRVTLPDGVVAHGLHLVELTVEPRRGREVLLWIVADAETLAPGVRVEPFRLTALPFLLGSVPGPILEVLWVVANPEDPWPLWSFRTAVDPHGADGVSVLACLGEQSHLHVLLTEPDGTVRRWIEVENPFRFEALEPLLERARALPAERVPEAADEAAVLFEREELLLAAERRGPEDVTVVQPSGEGRLVASVRRLLASRRDDVVRAIGADLRKDVGHAYVNALFAAFLRRCPDADGSRLAELWDIATYAD